MCAAASYTGVVSERPSDMIGRGAVAVRAHLETIGRRTVTRLGRHTLGQWRAGESRRRATESSSTWATSPAIWRADTPKRPCCCPTRSTESLRTPRRDLRH